MVLLWPHLKTFFASLGLIHEGVFKNEESRERALLILQVVCTGEAKTPEYQLPLNKILCGWPLEQPVRRGIRVRESEKQEIETLLQTTISQWPALGKTSIDGFRSSFLQRRGNLIRQEKNWLLQIEHKAFDMLLDYLPWSVAMIKLSWMDKLLVVEWNTTT